MNHCIIHKVIKYPKDQGIWENIHAWGMSLICVTSPGKASFPAVFTGARISCLAGEFKPIFSYSPLNGIRSEVLQLTRMIREK